MERSIVDITLDLQHSYSGGTVAVKRGDTHRTLRLHLADGGRPYRPGTGCTAVFTAVRPDGEHLYNACRQEADAYIYELTPQTTVVAGELECELRLYGEDGALLTSAAFTVTVADTVYADGDEAVSSSGEATALTKLMTEATQKLSQMEAVLNNEANHAVIDDTAVGADAWSSRNIVDKLCPAFTVSGYVAVCEPLEGYPLEVVSTIDTGADSITLTRCGKNLFDFNSGTQQLSWVDAEGTTFRYKGYAIKLPPGTYTIHCEQVSGITEKDYYIGTITVDANGVSRPRDTVGSGAIYWGNEATRITRTITIADGDILYAYDGQTNHTEAQADDRFSRENIQLEAGSAATAYEPYRGQTFTAEVAAAEGSYRWQTIPALAGTNVLYSDCGDTTVSGRLDPVPLLMKEV